MQNLGRTILLAGCLLLSACAIGPEHQPPDIGLDASYSHAPEGRWRVADQHAGVLQPDWWRLFNDPVLAGLVADLQAGNPDLVQAGARHRQAMAALAGTRAGLFPDLGLASSIDRSAQGVSGSNNPSNTYSMSLSARWEIDLWGRLRRDVEAAEAAGLASQADLDGMQLSLQSTLAQAYFALRAAQLEDALLARTFDEYSRALDMTRNRHAAGLASLADVAAARVQLEQARAQRIRLSWQREQQLHAIAVLLGRQPAGFTLPGDAGLPVVPDIPVGVPSQLLQHRPDVVAAERRVAQANARIGVARAAWFPELTLSAQGGYRAAEFASWLAAPARFWTLGPALALSIFDGGARSAAVESALAGYDEQAAMYRKTVLEALREVEDALVQSQALVREQAARDDALQAARETLRQTVNQYEAGMIDYLNVVQAQTSAFNAEQTTLDLQLQRLNAAVQLIAALGGGYPGIQTPAEPAAAVAGGGRESPGSQAPADRDN